MNGVAGWFGRAPAEPAATLAAMMARDTPPATRQRVGPSYAVAADGSSPCVVAHDGGMLVAIAGHPSLHVEGRRIDASDALASRLAAAVRRRGADAIDELDGDFALAIVDAERSRALLAVDRMGVRNVVYSIGDGGVAFGPTCDAVLAYPGVPADVDAQGVFDYLYSHVIPAPRTAYERLSRLPPGHVLEWDAGRTTVRPYWHPRFREHDAFRYEASKAAFRGALERSVHALADGVACGTFLSGGTDSSTLAGLLGTAGGGAARTFSIGFHAAGYDEMHYARIAAEHFRTEHHEYYVTPDDVVAAVPRIAQAYDQPFGNASAVPTYYCARLAREHGVARLLGGDGGDELYGGNARYAKQLQFALYDRVPVALRRGVLEPIGRSTTAARLPVLRKARSYVLQATTPMPDRYESYNLLARLGPENVLSPEFLASVDPSGPLRHLRGIWQDTGEASLINRMLALDFRLTLADNDLPKVTRMCELAGIDVAFPMLRNEVVDVSLGLPPREKVRGGALRYFFKRSLADFLPGEILRKEKHGFGLPVGAWLVSHPRLRELAGDSLAALRRRGIASPQFIDRLLDRHLGEHAAYYGTMVWVLMMLEGWYGRDRTLPQRR